MWISLCKNILSRMLPLGDLIIHYPDGSTQRVGDGTPPHVEAFILDAALPRKIILTPDMAVGEAYMDGRLTIKDDDIYGFLELAMRNRNHLSALPRDQQVALVRVQNWIARRLRAIKSRNFLERARTNVAHHYNLSDELYALFLDEDKQYSCAYFKTPQDSLEVAQEQKKHHIAAKLCLKPGMRVLDIGCGWGGMALTLARDYGVSVVGVTLSEHQHRIACERASEEKLDADFRLQDYRTLDGQFDRIVSVGMFEHVGLSHYHEYFAHLHRMLKPEGIALIHTIGRNNPPAAVSPWILKYIFPGGYLPSLSEVVRAIENERLETMDIEVLRFHYADTIAHWRARFEKNIDKARKIYDERFCRMWRYYLAACETTFRHETHVVFQFQLAKGRQGVPLTRDYLYK